MSSSLLEANLGSLNEAINVNRSKAGAPLQLPVKDLIRDPNQPRKNFSKATLKQLADSIKEHGVIQPIAVNPVDDQGRHRIKHGERRWRAAQLAGLRTVPAFIDHSADNYSQMIENIQREDLSLVEIAHWINARLEEGHRAGMIAKRLGKPASWVSLHRQLSELPNPIMSLYTKGVTSSARALVDVKRAHDINPTLVGPFCKRAIAAGTINRSDLDNLLTSAKGNNRPGKSKDRTRGRQSPRQQAKRPVILASIKSGRGAKKQGTILLDKPSTNDTAWLLIDGKQCPVSLKNIVLESIDLV